MRLSDFIISLLQTGKVSVKGQMESFDKEDMDEAKEILKSYYQEDITEMPYEAPQYFEEAALWAAKYLYNAVQLTVLRDEGKEIIRDQLGAYPGPKNASAIYSADLMLRYLPQLFQVVKGLAPGDVLVEELRKTAVDWPFSSVGIQLDVQINDDTLFEHLSLRYAYIDRIISEKDMQRIKEPLVLKYIQEVAGEHLDFFWPEISNS